MELLWKGKIVNFSLEQIIKSSTKTFLATSKSNSNSNEEIRSNVLSATERNFPPAPPRMKKQISLPPIPSSSIQTTNRAPMPPPRRTTMSQK